MKSDGGGKLNLVNKNNQKYLSRISVTAIRGSTWNNPATNWRKCKNALPLWHHWPLK